MSNISYFKDLFKPIAEYRKTVLIMFFLKNDVDLPNECGFLKNDNNRLSLELKDISLQQKIDYFDYNKVEEESFWKRF